jgi:GPH family glycoside/pentoside/hexuronide:cation symporter
MTTTTIPFEKLSVREKFSYSFGDLASRLFWQTFMLYLTFYYTDVFGISALAAGAMLGLSRSLDAFFDPIVGMLGDRTNSRWGKYRPYLLWICVPFAVAGVMTFTTPGTTVAANLEGAFGGFMRGTLGLMAAILPHGMAAMAETLKHEVTGKLIWAILTYNALMILYTAINIPYTAMLGVLTPNPKERTALSSIKFIGAFTGGILISFCLLPGVKRLSGNGGEAHGWQMAFVIIGIAVVVLFLTTFLNTRERVQPPPAQKTSVGRDLADLFTNVPWIVLLATTITFILYVAARGSVTVHYFKYFVGTQTITLPSWLPKIGGTQQWQFEEIVSWFNGTGQIASLIGVVLLPYVANRLGKKVAFISIFVVAIASTASFYLLKPDQIGLIFAINLLGSITGGPLSALLWAMYADTADYAEWKHGRRATGLIFSASIFSQKQGWAIGAWVALSLMAGVGFKANVGQTPDTLHGLRLLMSLIPAGVGLISILIVAFYPLNEVRMSRIEVDLKARRANDAAAPAAS